MISSGRSVSSARMRELDERAVREFKTPSLLLMENAGRSVAEEILKTGAGKIAIVSGKGNNGGDGFVVARHLHNHGRDVEVTFIGERGQLKGDSLINFEILEKLGVPLGIHTKDWDWGDADLVVDAIFGTGLSKNVEEPYKSAIEEINKLSAGGTTVVSIDVPSGLNADSGEVMGVAVHADITVTLASEKMGLRKGDGPRYAGQIVVGYISMPRALLNPNQF